jgi:hypothetical protein
MQWDACSCPLLSAAQAPAPHKLPALHSRPCCEICNASSPPKVWRRWSCRHPAATHVPHWCGIAYVPPLWYGLTCARAVGLQRFHGSLLPPLPVCSQTQAPSAWPYPAWSMLQLKQPGAATQAGLRVADTQRYMSSTLVVNQQHTSSTGPDAAA